MLVSSNDIEINTRAFVLLSGGIDSTTCLYIAREQFDGVEAISIDYGQKHDKEMFYARSTCKTLDIQHTILTLDPATLGGEGVMLTDADTVIPSISYDEIRGVSPTYVPFRNGCLLSLVTAHAQKWVMKSVNELAKEAPSDYFGNECTEDDIKQASLGMHDSIAGVFFGAHAEDAYNWAYPDCTPEFIGAMANAIYVGTYHTIRLHTPLMWMKKHEIIQCGEQFSVIWSDTWSCYAGKTYHCGVCPTCRARKEAFTIANVYDPTIYEDLIVACNPDSDEIPF